MSIRCWGLLLITISVLFALVTCVPNTYFTEDEDANLIFTQALDPDKSPDAYRWSLQYSHKERPFYVYLGQGDEGTFYTDMLLSPNQRKRMSVSFEIRNDTLIVKLSLTPIFVFDTAFYLLTVTEKGNENPPFIFEVYAAVQYKNVMDQSYMELTGNKTNSTLREKGYICSPAYTAPQVKDWRWVRIFATGKKGAALFCYKTERSPGQIIAGHMFSDTRSFQLFKGINIDASFYCCLDYPDQITNVRCEYYAFDSEGNLTLTKVTQEQPEYTPGLKPPTLRPTDGIDATAPQTITHVPGETEKENRLGPLSGLLALSITNLALVIAFIWLICIAPTRRQTNTLSEHSKERTENNENVGLLPPRQAQGPSSNQDIED